MPHTFIRSRRTKLRVDVTLWYIKKIGIVAFAMADVGEGLVQLMEHFNIVSAVKVIVSINDVKYQIDGFLSYNLIFNSANEKKNP